MSSGAFSGVTNGLQLTLSSFETNIKSELNVKKLEADFFTGPNGKTMPAIFKSWIGENKRDEYLKRTTNKHLKNAINQLYRPGSFIGDGGTASVINFEKSTGLKLGRNGNDHTQKGKEMTRYIENKVLKQSLTTNERILANKLLKDLKKAVGD